MRIVAAAVALLLATAPSDLYAVNAMVSKTGGAFAAGKAASPFSSAGKTSSASPFSSGAGKSSSFSGAGKSSSPFSSAGNGPGVAAPAAPGRPFTAPPAGGAGLGGGPRKSGNFGSQSRGGSSFSSPRPRVADYDDVGTYRDRDDRYDDYALDTRRSQSRPRANFKVLAREKIRQARIQNGVKLDELRRNVESVNQRLDELKARAMPRAVPPPPPRPGTPPPRPLTPPPPPRAGTPPPRARPGTPPPQARPMGRPATPPPQAPPQRMARPATPPPERPMSRPGTPPPQRMARPGTPPPPRMARSAERPRANNRMMQRQQPPAERRWREEERRERPYEERGPERRYGPNQEPARRHGNYENAKGYDMRFNERDGSFEPAPGGGYENDRPRFEEGRGRRGYEPYDPCGPNAQCYDRYDGGDNRMMMGSRNDGRMMEYDGREGRMMTYDDRYENGMDMGTGRYGNNREYYDYDPRGEYYQERPYGRSYDRSYEYENRGPPVVEPMRGGGFDGGWDGPYGRDDGLVSMQPDDFTTRTSRREDAYPDHQHKSVGRPMSMRGW